MAKKDDPNSKAAWLRKMREAQADTGCLPHEKRSGVAQSVEQRNLTPQAGGSSPPAASKPDLAALRQQVEAVKLRPPKKARKEMVPHKPRQEVFDKASPGEAETASTGAPFDKQAWQREYMRKYRAAHPKKAKEGK